MTQPPPQVKNSNPWKIATVVLLLGVIGMGIAIGFLWVARALIEKKYIDDFFEVLRWSKEFGVDSSEGRQIRQGVIGVFAGSAFARAQAD